MLWLHKTVYRAVPLKYVCALSHACWPIRAPTFAQPQYHRKMNAALDARESGLLRRLTEGRE